MAYTLKLTKGGKRLDLMTGRYMTDFVPPDVALRPLIAEGTSANKTGGGTLIDTRAGNRSLSFTVHVRGLSDHEVARGVADLRQWLGKAGDESDPLYLQYYPNDDIAHEPLWGQRSIYYEVVFGDAVRLTDTYGMADIRTRQADCQVTVTVKPYAVGKKQRLALASGGVGEDVIGSPNGASRGITVSEVSPTGGNEFTNPVFGNATWDTGWTADASLTAEQNTNPEFCLPGTTSSARLASRSTNQEFYDAINTGDVSPHAFSCYAKLPDGGAVSSTQVVLFYSSALTTSYQSVGDGWYRLTATATGINASTNTGVQVKDGYTVYVSGFQMEQAAYSTPLFYGDLLGCAWSGTAHDSASTRTVGTCKIPMADALKVGSFSVRAVTLWHVTDDHPNGFMIFDARDAGDTSAPHGYLDATGDDFRLGYGGTTIDSAAQTIAVGEIIVLHFVGSEAGGLVIYKNGASIASTATFAASTLGDYLFIGQDYTGGSNAPVTVMDLTTWDIPLTATEVLNDYTNITQVAADGERVGAIPYLWTKDGDGIVDNHNDSGEDNWCTCNGIPGSAESELTVTGTVSSNFSTVGSIWFSRFDSSAFIDPSNYYLDRSGTVDANSSGGQYAAVSTSTSDTSLATMSLSTVTQIVMRELAGRSIYGMTRLADAGSTLNLKLRYYPSYNGASYAETEYKSVAADATMRLFSTPPIAATPSIPQALETGFAYPPQIILLGKHTTGTANVNVDYLCLAFEPMIRLTSSEGFPDFVYSSSGRATIVDESTAFAVSPTTNVGKFFGLVPGKYNNIVSFVASEGTAATISYTITYDKAIVTPRYFIL